MNTDTLNTATDAIVANTTAAIPSETAAPAPDNTEKLAELATRVRAAYTKEHEADGMVVDWRAKQLKAGIEMGDCLNDAKALVPFKEFVKWCRKNFPELTQRTLNRYMSVARNKAHVSHAKGLRDAYKNCSTGKSACKSDEKSDTEKDFEKVQQHLTKAARLLNDYPDLIACEGADAICDMVEALHIWAADYRERSERHKLNKQHDAEFEAADADGQQPTTPEQNGEYVTTE